MIGVVSGGTGTGAAINGVTVAGKTGTAENATGYDHSWFIGFAPAENPKVAVAVVIENNKMYFLSVGDSKIYILRDNEILAVNREHNYRLSLDEKLKKGQITKEQYIAEEDQAEALISYLGMGNVSLMDINNEPFILQENDIVLLCSDGLYKRLPDKDIMQIIQLEEPDMNRAARRLTDVVMMRTRKNQDNSSLVLLQYSRH